MMRNPKEASYCFEQARKAYEKLPMTPEIIGAVRATAEGYAAMKMYPLAIKYSNDALKLAEDNGSLNYQDISLLQLSAIYKKTGNYKEALKYSALAQAISDSISQRSFGQRTSDLEAVFDLAKANNDMLNLKERIKYETQIRYILMGSSFLLLLVAGLLTKLYMQKKHHERKLEIEIAARMNTEEELKQLLAQLQKSFAEVKTLSGLIPICSECKKIRSDKGYWEHLEQYIQTHSEAKFSHGLCPECMKRLYPGFCKSGEEKVAGA